MVFDMAGVERLIEMALLLSVSDCLEIEMGGSFN